MQSQVSSSSGNDSPRTTPRSCIMEKKSNSHKKEGGILMAMMPGAKMNKKGKIILKVSTSKETVVFNVGGTKFETYWSTLHAQPNSKLADGNFLDSHFRKDQGDYFFDKDPDIFRIVLNYLRTGELHLPSYICGPAIKDELEYWGLSYQLIERCCWDNYNSWNSTMEALNQLERDRKGNLNEISRTPEIAKLIFGLISIIFVFLSIVSFLAGTHETFNYFIKVPANSKESSLALTNESDSTTRMKTTTVSDITPTSSTNYTEVKAKHPVLEIIDNVCLVFFTIEYIARLLTVPRKLKFIISAMSIIDLLALFPDYIELIIYHIRPDLHNDTVAVNFIQILRIIRILRIFRLIQHVPGLWIMIYTLKASFGELVLLTAFMMVGMLIFASLMYFVEDRTVFTSIPRGFWWALITMTTVGYGDMYPSTPLGYLIGSFAALSALLFCGFSVPILVNNFVLYYTHVQMALQEEKREKKKKKIEQKKT